MGALTSSTWEKAASGACPALGNADEEAMALPPKALSEAVEPEPPVEEVLDDRLVLAAVSELVGPNNWLAEVPPDTRPAEPLELAAPVRIKRLRKSSGLF